MSPKRGQHLFLRLNLGQLIVRAMALKETVTRDSFFRSKFKMWVFSVRSLF
jgi:hypothetical protein